MLIPFALAATAALVSAKPKPQPVPPSLSFSAGFSSDMVLHAGGDVAVYGVTLFPAAEIEVSVEGSGGVDYKVAATTFSAGNASTWRAQLR